MKKLITIVMLVTAIANAQIIRNTEENSIIKQNEQTEIKRKIETREKPISKILGSILKFEIEDDHANLWLAFADEDFATLRNMKVENFGIDVSINGVKRKISADQIQLRARSKNRPIATALLRDTSGSISDENLEQETLGIKNYIDQMDTRSVAEIIDFASNVKVRQKFTAKKDRLKKSLEGNVDRGGTALFAAMSRGVEDLSSLRNVLPVMIVFTDGEDGGSGSVEDVLKSAKVSAIPIFSIGMGSADETVLKSISRQTGGLYFYAENADQLADTYKKIAQLLDGMYLIRFPIDAKTGDLVGLKANVDYVRGGQKVRNTLEVEPQEVR